VELSVVNTLLLTIHVLACVSLVTLVLMQSGAQGMGVIFGGSSSSLFGSSGAGGLLTKLTVGVAVVFFVTSLTFTYMDASKRAAPPESVVLEEKKTEAPAADQKTKQPGAAQESDE
jgi:preprotein translocase subunit SecG